MLEILLQSLKFLAILVGTISGAVGTLTETRDKETGLPTPWARRIVVLVIVSGALAIATQGVESYLQKQADAKEEALRIQANQQIANILTDARAAATGIDAARKTQDETLRATQQTLTDLDTLQTRAKAMHGVIRAQERSIRTTATGIKTAAGTLQKVTAGQNVELENLYRLTHPLGKAEAQVVLWYPLHTSSEAFESSWLDRIRAAPHEQGLVIKPDTPLDPLPAEAHAYHLLRAPEFRVFFSKPPLEALTGKNRSADEEEAQLSFQTLRSETNVRMNYAANRIEHHIHADLSVFFDDAHIASWRDLYGVQFRIQLPEGAPKDARMVSCDIFFGGPSPTRVMSLSFKDEERRGLGYVKILTEKELGPRPQLVHEPSSNP